MTDPERWRQIQDLFAQASALEPHTQRAWLEATCRDDGTLRDEVASLLAAHHSSRAVLDRVAADYLPGDALDELADRWIGRRVGAYELTARIGGGGMGDVYRARRADAEFEKEVAIKLVRTGYDTRFVLERFRAERQILANLDHPNIARLLDGGATAEGLPYLVMELVDGEPLDAYCDSHHLSLSERLRLFREACVAVSFAHQRLVVHRDLKPGNILVTADGTIKLVDFGIAKILGEAPAPAGNATVTAVSLMTPAFSSPEQVLGQPVTTASDVYSLGVVLFHLITGRSPYRRSLATTQDAIREVCETEPVRPSEAADLADTKGQVTRAIPPRDLDDIVLKALRKEPEHRFSSVEQLSEDIRRYLTGLPVRAHSGRFSYRAGKFGRRHKVELGAAALLAIALLGGTVISLHEAHVAKVESALAERNFGRVRQLANSLLFELHDSIERLPGSTPALKLLVTRAREYLDGLAQENPHDDALSRELAIAYRRVGSIQGGIGSQNLGDAGGALEDYRKSVVILERIVARHPTDAPLKYELGTSLRWLATTEDVVGDSPAAMAISQRALELAREMHAADPQDARYGHLLAAVLSDRCGIVATTGDLEQALTLCHESVTLQERVVQQQDNREERRDLAVTYERLASTIANAVRLKGTHAELLPESVTITRKALAIDSALARQYPAEDSPKRDVVIDHAKLAVSLFFSGDVTGALNECHVGIALVDEVLARDPENVAMRVDAATLRRYVGYADVAAGKPGEAVDYLDDALARFDALPPGVMTASNENEKAAVLATLGKAHALLAAETSRSSAASLQEWRTAQVDFASALSQYEGLKRRRAFDASYSNYWQDAMEGSAQSRIAIERLSASTAQPPSAR